MNNKVTTTKNPLISLSTPAIESLRRVGQVTLFLLTPEKPSLIPPSASYKATSLVPEVGGQKSEISKIKRSEGRDQRITNGVGLLSIDPSILPTSEHLELRRP